MDYSKIPSMSFGDQLILASVEFPQANDLRKAFEVARLVSDDCVAPDEIAAALGMVVREGSYYGSAACALRLVKKRESAEGSRYELTEMGDHWLGLERENQTEAMIQRTLDCPHVKLVAHVLGIALPLKVPVDRLLLDKEKIKSVIVALPGITGNTVVRRASTIASWIRTVNELAD